MEVPPTVLPRVPFTYVPRPRLARRLDRLTALTVIDALPGFGARTCVAAWLHEQHAAGRSALWLRPQPAAEAADPLDRVRAGLVLAGALPDAHQRPVERWPGALARGARPVVVMVEDARPLLAGRTADRLLTLVQRTPSLHLVLRAYDSQAFTTAARRRGIEVQVIRDGDLRLRPDEARRLADAWGYPIDETTATGLVERFGGWLLPLRLGLDAAADPGAVALHPAHLFVLEEIVPLLGDPDGPVAALALPDGIDGALAQELLPEVEARQVQDLLAGLEQRGVLRRDPGTTLPRWCFVPMIRSALVERLARTRPELARRLHRTTASALVRRHGPSAAEAAHHAHAAADRRLLERIWVESGWTLVGTDVETFERCYGDLSPAEGDGLSTPHALAWASRLVPADADWLHRAETLMRCYVDLGARVRRGGDHGGRIDDLTAAMVAVRTEGRLVLAAQLADDLERVVRLRRPGLTGQAAWAWAQAAISHLLAGRASDAHRLAAAANAPGDLVGQGAAALLALTATMAGESATAQRWSLASQALDDAPGWGARLAGLPRRLVRAHLALDALDRAAAEAALEDTAPTSDVSGILAAVVAAHARYALLFGAPVAMLAQLASLTALHQRHLAVRGGWWRQVFDRASVDLLLAIGEVDRARALLDQHGTVPAWLVAPAARLHLITGDHRRAARAARAGAWEGVVARDRMELLVISARAFDALGRGAEAADDLRRAVALGQHTGTLEPYLLLGGERDRMLAAAGVELGPEATRVLDRTPPAYPASATLVRLTPREQVVLREMTRHDTAAAVARSLSVSVNTVKKQMVSIYAKLGVHDRSAALVRARRLGLLSPAASAHDRG